MVRCSVTGIEASGNSPGVDPHLPQGQRAGPCLPWKSSQMQEHAQIHAQAYYQQMARPASLFHSNRSLKIDLHPLPRFSFSGNAKIVHGLESERSRHQVLREDLQLGVVSLDGIVVKLAG